MITKQKTAVLNTVPNRIGSLNGGPSAPKTKQLPPLNIKRVDIWIEGDSELICHRFSPKAQEKMLDKQMGEANSGRPKRNPEDDFKESLYPIAGGKGYGFPAGALKRAAVEACTSSGKSITKVQARQAFFVIGGMLRIDGSEPYMRQDAVRNAGGTTDLRFRPAFKKWGIHFQVRFNANVFTEDQVVNLFNMAGFAVGIGDWRPECDGSFGQFHVSKIGSSG